MSDGIADVKPAEEATRGRSIHEIFIRCLDLYRILASYILEDDDSNAGRGIEFDRNRVLDEFGRLRIWGEETKAALEPKARSSLDDFLRDEERLSGEVKEVLNQLKIGISMAVSTVKDSSTQHSEQYGDPSGISASTSAYSSDSGSEDSRERASGRAKISKLSIILSHIFEYIQLLYHFGSLLRRPGLKGRYLRHDDSKHPDLTTIFETCHIEEKLRHWDRQAAGGVGVSPEEEKAVTEQTISERLAHESATNLHCVLSRRFARANGQRREQLKYWSKNPYQLDVSQGYETRKIVGESEIPQKMKRGGAVTEDETSTIQLEHKESRSQKSRTTVVTFSTVAESVLLGAGTETGRPQTVYAESVVAGRWSARVPPPPKPTREVNGTEQYECPYCHMNLDAKLVKDSVAWKRHVFRDLRPYSCTSMDCKNPNKLYTTRHEWKYHEMQIHRRNWVCYKCDCTFEEKAALVQHLRDNHPGNWTDRQLSVILEMSERPMDDSVILPCSLCKSQLSLAKLLDHLAAHMEEIALFVIPPTNSGPGDDTYSNDAMRTDTENGNENGGASPHSSLRFSDVAQSDRELLESSSGYGAQISDIKQYLFTHGISNEFNEPTGNMGTEQNIPRKLNDIDLILKHLLEAGSTAPGTQAHITRGQIHYLCKIAKEKFLSQPTLLELQAPIKSATYEDNTPAY
ncbi:hypothetical protein F4777DRAFT_100632 [Nemania sp. FL0916]|nr:hypothetical protein F4777DRAFT_100632 [Nemania sp. FL0916]